MSRNIRSGRGVVGIDTISYSVSHPQSSSYHNYNQIPPCCSSADHHPPPELPPKPNHISNTQQPLYPLHLPLHHSSHPPCEACTHCSDDDSFEKHGPPPPPIPPQKPSFFRPSPSPDQLQRRHTVANYNQQPPPQRPQHHHLPHQPKSFPDNLPHNNINSRHQIIQETTPPEFWCGDCGHQDFGPPCSCASPDAVTGRPDALRYSISYHNNLQHQEHHPILHNCEFEDPQIDEYVPYPNMPRASSDWTVSILYFCA